MRPERTRKIPPVLLAVWLLTGPFLVVGCGGGSPARVAVGEPAPAFELPALGGGRVGSEDLAGRPALLSFWATWCQPCLAEIPVLNELAGEGGVRVVSIALDEEGERLVGPFVKKHGLRYPVLLGNQQVFQRFDGLTIPYTLLLDAEGRITALYRGTVTRDRLRADLAALGGG